MLFAIISYLYYALKITKMYVKNNTSKNTPSNEIIDIELLISVENFSGAI